jgi:hypothetical protein
MRECIVCAARLSGRQTKYCSKRCKVVADGTAALARPGFRRQKNERQRRRRAAKAVRLDFTCVQCGAAFGVQNPEREPKYCSSQCEASAKAVSYKGRPAPTDPHPRRTAARRKLKRAAREHRTNRRWVQGRCRRCGDDFLVQNRGPSLAAFCSDICAKRDANSRRRAIEAAAYVELVHRHKVFERDQWTCQLCGDPVLPDAEVPHPLAPTIDHIVPLAKGGTHEASNVQLAHFLCNSTKSDGTWWEQGAA